MVQDYVIIAQTVSIAALQLLLQAIKIFRSVREGRAGCAAWKCCGQSPEDDANGQESRLAARLAEIRLDYMEGFAGAWVNVSGVYAIAQLVRLALDMTPITIGMNTLWWLTYIAATVVQSFPSLVKKTGVWMCHFFFNSLLLCWYANVLFYSDIPAEFLKLHVFLQRTMLGIVHPAVGPNLMWNVASGILSVVTSRDAELDYVIFTELTVAVGNTYLIWQFDKLQTNQVRSDIKASGYLRAKKMMERLLGDMCDAVVELDSALHIRQACPKLAGMLIRHEGNGALKGETFAQLGFAEQDRERFDEFVAQRSVPMAHEQNFDSAGSASSMYLSLKDACGSPVPVQLFHSCHHDPLDVDDVCHVVGVHEVEKTTNTEGARDTPGTGVGMGRSQKCAKDTLGELSMKATLAALSDDAESVTSDVSTSSRATSSFTETSVRVAPLMPESSDGPIRVMFNPYTNEIIASTAAFQALTGPVLHKASMGEYVVNFDDFRAWVLTEVNGMLLKIDPSTFPIALTPTMIRKHARFEFHAEAALLDIQEHVLASQLGVERSSADDEGEEEEHEIVCVMVLAKPQPKWKRDKPTRSLMKRKRAKAKVRQQREPKDSTTLVEL